MALLAIKVFLMDVKPVLILVKGVFVTCPADLLLAALEQTRSISCVGAVTCGTAVPLLIQEVAMRGRDFVFYRLVATQAVSCAHPVLPVALGTILLKGLVEEITEQCLVVASVRVVAGKTVLNLSGRIRVGMPHSIPFMAGKTQFVRIRLEELGLCGLMGPVTGQTGSLSVR